MNAAAPTPRILPLTVKDLGFRIGEVTVLNGVSLNVAPGTRNIVMGANGAGKSVLLRLLHGLLTPTVGSVRWSQAGDAAIRRAQAMVFQRPVMLRRSVRENVEFALKLAGAAELRYAAEAALDRVGLLQLADRPARLCSGGEQQRVALARAWALEPELLILDEPTASLDPGSTREVERIIGEIAAGGARILMTTHNLGQARRMADEIVFIDRGRVLEQTPVARFFNLPQSEAAQRFLQEETP